jgi:hypothetical protein
MEESFFKPPEPPEPAPPRARAPRQPRPLTTAQFWALLAGIVVVTIGAGLLWSAFRNTPRTWPVTSRDVSGRCPKGFDVAALPEVDRRAVFRAVIEAEDRAEAEALRTVPTPPLGTSKEVRREVFKKQYSLLRELTQRYREDTERVLAETYRAPLAEVEKVWLEGVCRNWASGIPQRP